MSDFVDKENRQIGDNMNGSFLENFHSAAPDFPYFDGDMKNIHYFSHFHHEAELAKVVKGNVEVCCGRDVFTAGEGDICIFMPGEIHSFVSVGDSELYIMKINCKNSVEKQDFSALRICPNVIKKDDALNVKVSGYMDMLKRELSERSDGFGYFANSVANMILCEVLRYDKTVRLSSDKKRHQRFAENILGNVNAYIEKHFSEKISLEDVAKCCNLSRYYFAHEFKRITNTTFLNYLTAYRLESAQVLLGTGMKMTEIAFECGFPNVRSFNRAFRSVYGMAPTEYIKRM